MNKSDNSIAIKAAEQAEAIGGEVPIEPGQWYWVKGLGDYERHHELGDVERGAWLGCVTEIGSNYLKLESVKIDGAGISTRVHFDDFWTKLEAEPDADHVIQTRVRGEQEKLNALLGQVKEVTNRLGVAPTDTVIGHSPQTENALTVVSNQIDTAAYKRELIVAKEKTLPDLFKEIEQTNKRMAGWMAAPILPMQAAINPMKKTIAKIDDRIHTVELYAGITETVVQCRNGATAAHGEKLRVMQRRHYMDEECLLSYEAGGMEMKDISAFDEWISQPQNRDRILPFQRCLVAFRVRREEKKRDDDGTAWRSWVNIQLAQEDKLTFLYIRNGEQVWRINTTFEFDERIFPDESEFDPTRGQMVKMWGGAKVEEIIPLSRYEVLKAEYDENGRLAEAWRKANPAARAYDNPHRSRSSFDPKEWKPFNASNVYFDEALATVQDQIRRYNQIAVIIQGLFDRSQVLMPHGKVSVADPVSFGNAIELIYDATTLTYGEAPDFEEFRASLNASITPDSVMVGQEDFWLRKEAEKRNKQSYNSRHHTHYRRYRPEGDPGPGRVALMAEWKPRVRAAVFKWEASKAWWRDNGGGRKPRTVTVPVDALMNVSAYHPGDFKRFFADPRTRADYLKWAPLMLAAEDYHAGKLTLGPKESLYYELGVDLLIKGGSKVASEGDI